MTATGRLAFLILACFGYFFALGCVMDSFLFDSPGYAFAASITLALSIYWTYRAVRSDPAKKTV